MPMLPVVVFVCILFYDYSIRSTNDFYICKKYFSKGAIYRQASSGHVKKNKKSYPQVSAGEQN